MSGRTEEAFAHVERALERVRGSKRILVVRLHRRHARLAMDTGQVFLAQAAARTAAQVAKELASENELAECLLLEASVEHVAFADPERALDLLASQNTHAQGGNVAGRIQLTKMVCCLDLGHRDLAAHILSTVKPTEDGRSFLNAYLELFAALLPLEQEGVLDVNALKRARERAHALGAWDALLQTHVWEALASLAASRTTVEKYAANCGNRGCAPLAGVGAGTRRARARWRR